MFQQLIVLSTTLRYVEAVLGLFHKSSNESLSFVCMFCFGNSACHIIGAQ